MDLIYVRTMPGGAVNSGYLLNYSAEFDITTDLEYATNTFRVSMILPTSAEDLLWTENGIKTIIYADGTEYGGVIEGSEIDIEENTITYTGRTWRGHLSQWVIEPPAGQDYLTVSGNLATILRALPMGSYLSVADTTYTTGTYSFQRYVTTFEGVTQLLEYVSSNLRFSVSYDSTIDKAVIQIAPGRDLCSLIEVSQDYNNRISLKIIRDGNTPKHLICLGQGDLKDREVIHYYATDSWQITQTPIAGAFPVETYDSGGSENLAADGLSHYKELIENHEQIEVNIKDLNVILSDVIAAKDIYTGQDVKAEIISIIWRVDNFGSYQEESFEYQTKLVKAIKKKESIDLSAITNAEIDTILNS